MAVAEKEKANTTKNTTNLTKEEARDLVEVFRYMLDAYAFFAEKLGSIQRDHEEAFQVMFKPEAIMQIPETLSQLSEKAPELNKLLTKIFVQLSAYLPQLSNLMALSAENKIKLGQNLKLLAKDFGELQKWIDEVKE